MKVKGWTAQRANKEQMKRLKEGMKILKKALAEEYHKDKSNFWSQA